jgi:hypothetical protein
MKLCGVWLTIFASLVAGNLAKFFFKTKNFFPLKFKQTSSGSGGAWKRAGLDPRYFIYFTDNRTFCNWVYPDRQSDSHTGSQVARQVARKNCSQTDKQPVR